MEKEINNLIDELINNDYIYARPDVKGFEIISYNPDSESEGQFVVQCIAYETVTKIARQTTGVEDFFCRVDELAYTELIDKGTLEYDDFIKKLSSSPSPDFIGRTISAVEGMIDIVKNEQDQILDLTESEGLSR